MGRKGQYLSERIEKWLEAGERVRRVWVERGGSFGGGVGLSRLGSREQ